ncbi:hypothetical protein, partial [Microtetraspora sp. AC03309]|uniref:hypothetical protein n=1 Tax=Microtetraspora sp. AC03309 TaxID=2779376 RepID=UPI001E5AF1C9
VIEVLNYVMAAASSLLKSVIVDSEGHGRGEEPGNCSRQGLPGVWGAERIDSGGGNWGGPPRPGNLRR